MTADLSRESDTPGNLEDLTTAQIARHGVDAVLDEIEQRGGAARRLSQGRTRLELTAPDGRKRMLYVKTRRRGDWQTSTTYGQPREPETDERDFWVFVDLTGTRPEFFIAPDWWIENNIYEEHRAYLARHGGRRARTQDSTHHRITTDRVIEWKARWDLLGL